MSVESDSELVDAALSLLIEMQTALPDESKSEGEPVPWGIHIRGH